MHVGTVKFGSLGVVEELLLFHPGGDSESKVEPGACQECGRQVKWKKRPKNNHQDSEVLRMTDERVSAGVGNKHPGRMKDTIERDNAVSQQRQTTQGEKHGDNVYKHKRSEGKEQVVHEPEKDDNQCGCITDGGDENVENKGFRSVLYGMNMGVVNPSAISQTTTVPTKNHR